MITYSFDFCAVLDDDSSVETGQCESDSGTDIYSLSNTDQPHVSEVKRPTKYPHGNDNYCKILYRKTAHSLSKVV